MLVDPPDQQNQSLILHLLIKAHWIQWLTTISAMELSQLLTALTELIRIINPWSIKAWVHFEINVWSLYDLISIGYMRSSNLQPVGFRLSHGLKTSLTPTIDYDVSVWKWDQRLGFITGLHPLSKHLVTLLTSTRSIIVSLVTSLHSSASPLFR